MPHLDILIADRRNPYKLLDTAESLLWSCSGESVRIFGVTIGYEYAKTAENIEISRSHLSEQFEDSVHLAAKLHQLYEQEQISDKVIFLNSDWLAITTGLAKWIHAFFEKSGVDLIGVADHFSYETYYNTTCRYLTDLKVPHEGWESSPLALNSKILILNQGMVGAYYERNLLTPANYENCPIPHGVFLSWCAPMLGKSVLPWGTTNNPTVPIYCVPPRTLSQTLPSPTILSPFFILYHGTNRIMGLSEFSVREYYKTKR